MKADATETIAIGDLVSGAGLNTAKTKNTVSKSAMDDYVVGIALTGGDEDEEIEVGLLRQPYVKPNPA